FDKAVAIENHLRSRFAYTLNLTGKPGADPLAHFLFETRAGHCEYFASAMIIMLRTLGIPSREVNGLLPAEYTELGGEYSVRARLFSRLRGSNGIRRTPHVASRLYAELLRMLARRGLRRGETQTPFVFAAAVDSPNLAAPVREFTHLYAHARFGGAPCDTSRLKQLLDQVRAALRGR